MRRKEMAFIGILVFCTIFHTTAFAQSKAYIETYQEQSNMEKEQEESIIKKEQESLKLNQKIQSEVYDVAQDRYHDNYGGTYLDLDQNLVVQFVDMVQVPDKIRNMSKKYENIVLKEVSYSYNQLNTIYEKISQTYATGKSEYCNIAGLTLSIKENSVIVTLKDCSKEKIQAFQEKVADYGCIRYEESMGEAVADNISSGEEENKFIQNGLEYKVTAIGEKANKVIVTGASTKKRNVVVPATINFNGVTYKVTAIGEGAFFNNQNIQKVTIGKNISKVEKRAFSNCKNLIKIRVKANNLKKSRIESYAFYKVGTNGTEELDVQVPVGRQDLIQKIQKQAGR